MIEYYTVAFIVFVVFVVFAVFVVFSPRLPPSLRTWARRSVIPL